MHYGRERAEWDRVAGLICNLAAIQGRRVRFEDVHPHYGAGKTISLSEYVKQQKAKDKTK